MRKKLDTTKKKRYVDIFGKLCYYIKNTKHEVIAMPELPDLENFSKNIFSLVEHKKILSLEVHNSKKIVGDMDKLKSLCTDSFISRIFRNGKELYFYLDNGFHFSVHLMLNGRFHFCTKAEISNVKYKIITLNFETDECLVVQDFQALCKVSVEPIMDSVPDALSTDFSLDYFLSKIVSYKKTIKALLIDQSFVKGIGNAYVDEILWTAKVDPESIACKIPENICDKLYYTIQQVLAEAIVKIENIAPNIIGGEERSFLTVHNPNSKSTPDGEEILTKKVASKNTYYTSSQILYS